MISKGFKFPIYCLFMNLWEKRLIAQMKLEKLYKLYIKRIKQGESIKLRVHHLRGFYDCVKFDEKWPSLYHSPEYNDRLVENIAKKIVENPSSKIKVVADFDFACDF